MRNTQAPGHWTQALAGALQMGIGGHYGAKGAYGMGQGKMDANKRLGALLAGGDPKAAAQGMLQDAWLGDEGRKLAMQELDPMRKLQMQKAQLAIENARSDMALNPLRRQKLQAELDSLRAASAADSYLMNMGGGAEPQQPEPVVDVPQDGAGRFAAPQIAPAQTEPTIDFAGKTIPISKAVALASAVSKSRPMIAKQIFDEVKKAQGVSKLRQLGIDPDSAEGQMFLLTGKMPAKAYEKMANESKKTERGRNIVAGLEDLNRMTQRYDDPSFENAVGPYQGSEPDGLAGAVPINIARGFGEAMNFFKGGKNTPSEVRSAITGATEALAAAIKPLIRAPGEGPWTDADQARLVAVVGNLPQASTKEEFKRRLNVVRDRVAANFGIALPFDAFAGADKTSPPKDADDGWRTVGGRRIREVR